MFLQNLTIFTINNLLIKQFKISCQNVQLLLYPEMVLGTIVLKEALRVLDAAGFEADYIHGDIGWEFWCKEGNPLPKRTIDLIEKHKIALFGAITSKPNDEAKAELSPAPG